MTSILDAIGNTPLVRLQRCAPANGAELWVKLEYRNPTGSMKDRMALAMIEGAERDGLLSPGRHRSGVHRREHRACDRAGLRSEGLPAADRDGRLLLGGAVQLLRALGAEVDEIPSVEGRPKVTAQDIRNMMARAAELSERPGHYGTDQFSNPYIVPAHRAGLGREIWEQTKGRVTAFCQGVGTATSLLGVSQALRPQGVFIQGHEPASSAAITGGGSSGAFAMQGWAGFVPPLWDPDAVDHVEPIGNEEAIAMTLRLAREEGIFAGVSSGANVVGAHRLAERLGPDAVIVTLAVDSGFKYLSVAPYLDL